VNPPELLLLVVDPVVAGCTVPKLKLLVVEPELPPKRDVPVVDPKPVEGVVVETEPESEGVVPEKPPVFDPKPVAEPVEVVAVGLEVPKENPVEVVPVGGEVPKENPVEGGGLKANVEEVPGKPNWDFRSV